MKTLSKNYLKVLKSLKFDMHVDDILRNTPTKFQPQTLNALKRCENNKL
jgi:hypothetical protein